MISEEVVEDAIRNRLDLPDETFEESTLVLLLIQENITKWKAEMLRRRRLRLKRETEADDQ